MPTIQRAVVVTEFGGPERLTVVEDWPFPKRQSGEVRRGREDGGMGSWFEFDHRLKTFWRQEGNCNNKYDCFVSDPPDSPDLLLPARKRVSDSIPLQGDRDTRAKGWGWSPFSRRARC